MGSIEVQRPDTPCVRSTKAVRFDLDANTTSTVEPNGSSEHSFSIAAAGTSQWNTDGLESEITLLSWLVVLLRTREDTQFWFEWAYQSEDDEEAPAYRVHVGEIVTDLNATVKDTLAKLSRHVKQAGPSPSAPSSLLLSTASLARTSSEILEEVSSAMVSLLPLYADRIIAPPSYPGTIPPRSAGSSTNMARHQGPRVHRDSPHRDLGRHPQDIPLQQPQYPYRCRLSQANPVRSRSGLVMEQDCPTDIGLLHARCHF